MIPEINEIPVVCEHLDVFPKELTKLSLDCELEFTNEVVSSTHLFQKLLTEYPQ